MGTEINPKLVQDLERHALVNLDSESGIRCLNEALKFADQMFDVDTTLVRPMISPVYSRNEHLCSDDVTEGNNRQKLMELADKTEEFYYVAPPGNCPVDFNTKESEK